MIKVTEGGKNAHLGLGFADRADSFDLNTTLHDHFKGILVRNILDFKVGKMRKKVQNITAIEGTDMGEGPLSIRAFPNILPLRIIELLGGLALAKAEH